MFMDLNIENYIDNLNQESENEKNKLINKYSDIKKEILGYCSKHNIIISEPNLLIDKEYITNMLTFDLYSSHPFKHANNLSNELVKYTTDVVMQTKISHQEFTIRINSQIIPIVNFYKLQKTTDESKDFKQSAIVTLSDISDNRFIKTNIGSHDLLLLPPHTELMNIYRKLYSSSCATKWKNLLELEDNIFKSIDKTASTSIIKPTDSQTSLELKKTIFSKWCKDKDIVIIGYWAISLLNISSDKISKEDRDKMHHERLQIISPNPIKNDMLSLELFVEKEMKYKLTYTTNNVDIPYDFRLKKHTIWAANSSKKFCIIEIYNSAEYELIPYCHITSVDKHQTKLFSEYKIGNPFVLLRFLFIVYWTIEFIMSIGKLPEQIGNDKLNNIVKITRILRTDLSNGFGKTFIGSYEDENIADKIRQIESPSHFPYMPAVKKRII